MPHRRMGESNGNQERSGLRADSWLQNPRGTYSHFFRAGTRWSESAVCGTARRSMADGITTAPGSRCRVCVSKTENIEE